MSNFISWYGLFLIGIGMVAILTSKLVFRLIFGLGRLAFVIARIAIICFVAGLEVDLLITRPEIFALEFLGVAALAYAWRRFARDRGYSPIVALRRRFHLGARAPLVLEQMSEDVEVAPDTHPIQVAPPVAEPEAPATAGSGDRIDIVNWLDQEMNGAGHQSRGGQPA